MKLKSLFFSCANSAWYFPYEAKKIAIDYNGLKFYDHDYSFCYDLTNENAKSGVAIYLSHSL